MGFIDRFRKGKLFFGRKEPAMVVRFAFKGKEYILEEFDLEFRQDLDARNKPDGETYGGLITLTISEDPGEWLTAWMLNSFEKQDGRITFYLNGAKITEGAAFHLVFKEAYCISYQQVMNPHGSGLLTTIIISPHIIRAGNEEYVSKCTR